MNQQSLTVTAPDVWVKTARLEPFISNCYRPALEGLEQAYAAGHPAAVLISEGQVAPSLIIDKFLSKRDESVTVVRVPGRFADATTCMRHIIKGIGFESSKLTLNDLENVLEMYLVFQRNKKQRTIICFENSHSNDWWVVDMIQRLIEREATEKHGLMVVQSDLPSKNSDAVEPVLDINNSHRAIRIVLSPFTLSETREFVRQRVESPDANEFRVEDVSQIFEFFAVTLIHEFSSGVPEYVAKLCSKCLRLMRDAGDTEVSTDTVRNAAKILGMQGVHEDEPLSRKANGHTQEVALPGRLVVTSPGEAEEEYPLDQNCILIGRDRLCAVCIAGLKVSRYHALVALSSHGVQLVDLGSTNGTKVNGEPVDRCTIHDSDEISIGTINIKYIAGGEALAFADDSQMARDFEKEDEIAEPPITYVGEEVQLLRTT